KGAHVVLHREFDPGLVLADIDKYGVESMFGAPAMYLFMSQHPSFETTDMSSVKMFICGGAPVPLPLIELYEKRNIPFCQGYGLTETAPFGSMLTPDFASSKTGSAGLPPIFNGLKIVDSQRRTLPAGEKGEVCLRGPNVMKGYWNRPEATAEAIDEEGWFYSGDVGHLDEEGFLFISDRVKDMVISGGENVYPAEVESALLNHPDINEVAVIGLPDEKWGEAVTAVVVLKDGSDLTLESLREFAGENLARYKLPLRLHKIDELPRNPAGKILKFKLREQFS
ncbi:MAG: AMP-binding protein, partial [Pseudomonadales bacterium]